MARQAAAAGAQLHTARAVRRLAPRPDGVTVEWERANGSGSRQTESALFDLVVLTTDMTITGALAHDDNPGWPTALPVG
jgi:hypothetical protein